MMNTFNTSSEINRSPRRIHYLLFSVPALIGVFGGMVTLFVKGQLFKLSSVLDCMERHGIGFHCITEHASGKLNDELIIFNFILQGVVCIGWPVLLAWVYKNKLSMDRSIGFLIGTIGCLLFMYIHWNLAIEALTLHDTGGIIFFMFPVILFIYLLISLLIIVRWLLIKAAIMNAK